LPAIRVRDLRKSYGAIEAVRGVDFDVAEGEVFGFLGPNGAGKTTIVEILEGYRRRSSGEVEVLGHDPARSERRLRERIGIVLQETGVERFLRVAEVLEALVGLEEKRNEVVKLLSGGQRRRLDLALGLAGDPELVFLDEPTTGFDPTARREAWDIVRNLRDLGKTVFLTTHYMDEAQHLADRVAVIAAGRIVAQGPPDRLSGRDDATEIRFSPTPALDLPDLRAATVTVNGRGVVVRTTDPTATLHTLTGWALEKGVTLDGLTVARPTLEDVYLELTATNE
jgi:ABC-2 type transport system ATP-binding protein